MDETDYKLFVPMGDSQYARLQDVSAAPRKHVAAQLDSLPLRQGQFWGRFFCRKMQILEHFRQLKLPRERFLDRFEDGGMQTLARRDNSESLVS